MKYCDQRRSGYPDESNVCPTDNSLLRRTVEFFPGITIRDKFILDKVGEPGVGTVYRARHLAFNEMRALKVAHIAFLEDGGFIKNFKTKAIGDGYRAPQQHTMPVRVGHTPTVTTVTEGSMQYVDTGDA